MNIQDALNALATEVYDNAVAHAFHDKDAERSDVENFAIWTANITGEVSELWEAARKGTLTSQCDKAVPLTCEEEELADIVIRALDTATARGINIGHAVLAKHYFNKSRPLKHGGKLA